MIGHMIWCPQHPPFKTCSRPLVKDEIGPPTFSLLPTPPSPLLQEASSHAREHLAKVSDVEAITGRRVVQHLRPEKAAARLRGRIHR